MNEKQLSGLDADSMEILRELEQSTPEAVKRLRAHARLTIRARVIVEPANMSDRGNWRIQGVTGDLSAGGTQILVPRPLHVGDIYLLSFDRKVVDVAPVFARCLRSRLVREDAFEAGLKFFAQIVLPETAGVGANAAV